MNIESLPLDTEQQAAATSRTPLILVSAAPGSGKSRTLVARVLWLIQQGADPQRICCVTFTNSGARVMQERLPGIRLGHCGTLHSLALRMLREHGHLVGLPKRMVTVMDEDGAEAALQRCKLALRVTCTDKALHEAVEWWRKLGPEPHPTKEATVAGEYHNRQRTTGELDYDSLLTYFDALMCKRKHGKLLGFDHLLVDEVQDAARMDWSIYEALDCKTKFFVGDSDQAIYGFRGGDIGPMLDLADNHPAQCILFPLTTNYRSANVIVDTSRQLIAHNIERLPMGVTARPGAPAGDVEVREFENPAAELAAIAKAISDYTDQWATTWRHQQLDDAMAVKDTDSIRRHIDAAFGGVQVPQSVFGGIAVLWRNNREADTCRDYLRGLGIKCSERKRVADAPEAKLGRAAVAFLTSPWNDEVALRFVEARQGADAAAKLRAKAAQEMCSIGSIIGIAACTAVIDKPCNNDVVRMVMDHIAPTAAPWVCSIADTLPQPFALGDLLLAVQRPEEADTATDGDGVFVGTAHSAKGKEWDCVFVAGMEAEAWERKGEDTEAERRLAYVAVTRAKSRVVVSWCRSRPHPFKTWQQEPKTRSRFVGELMGGAA